MTERRVGQRVPADGFEVGWHETVELRRTWTGRQVTEDRIAPGIVEDVSATGARILVRSDHLRPVGETVAISAGTAAGTVVVRRCEPLDDDLARYGVEFEALDDELRAALFDRIERRRPAHLRQRWERGD